MPRAAVTRRASLACASASAVRWTDAKCVGRSVKRLNACPSLSFLFPLSTTHQANKISSHLGLLGLEGLLRLLGLGRLLCRPRRHRIPAFRIHG